MSRYLALDAEQGQIYLASTVVKGSSVKVEKAISQPIEGTLTAATAAALGKRLKEAMKEAGIAPAPLLVSVGRERVVLKEVKYPATISASEEPALVKFQMSKELAEGGENVIVDYFVLPTPDPDGQRRALAFAIRKDVLGPIRALAAAAGLKLIGVTPRPFGIAASLMRAVKDGAVTPPESLTAPIAILVRGDKWGELVIIRGGHVAFSRSLTAMALNAEAAMLGEIRRNLAVFAGQSAQNQVQALYVAEGDLPGGWTGRVRAGLTIPVQSFDPIAGVESDISLETRGCFAGLTGLTALRARSVELPVNFLNPREPKAHSDPNKRMLGLIGVAASLLLVGGLALGLFLVAQKSKAANALRAQKSDLEDDLKKLDDTSRRVAAVKDWENKGINWLDELYDLTARFPDPSGAEVIQLVGKPIPPVKNSANKHVADLELTINTGSARAVDTLVIDMSHDKQYEVAPKQSKGAARGSAGGSVKNQQFVFKAKIEHREPTQYVQKLNAIPYEARERKKDGRKLPGGKKSESDGEGEKKEPDITDLTGGFGGFGGMQ